MFGLACVFTRLMAHSDSDVLHPQVGNEVEVDAVPNKDGGQYAWRCTRVAPVVAPTALAAQQLPARGYQARTQKLNVSLTHLLWHRDLHLACAPPADTWLARVVWQGRMVAWFHSSVASSLCRTGSKCAHFASISGDAANVRPESMQSAERHGQGWRAEQTGGAGFWRSQGGASQLQCSAAAHNEIQCRECARCCSRSDRWRQGEPSIPYVFFCGLQGSSKAVCNAT